MTGVLSRNIHTMVNLPLQGANYCWRNNPGTLPRAKMNWAFSPQVFAYGNMRCISQSEQFQYMLIRGLEYTYSLIRSAPKRQFNSTRWHRHREVHFEAINALKEKVNSIQDIHTEHILPMVIFAPKGQLNCSYANN